MQHQVSVRATEGGWIAWILVSHEAYKGHRDPVGR